MTDVSGTKGAKGEKFLNKGDRQKCWNARDDYWACMNKNNEDAEKCQELRNLYTGFCPQTWVKISKLWDQIYN